MARGSAPLADPFPIFVGGTGRSGTTIMGRLLGRHPDYAVIPLEAKFHADPKGLAGVVSGKVPADEFAALLEAGFDTGPPLRGIARITPPDRFARALEDLVRAAEIDRPAAARLFMQTIFGGYARDRGRRAWIEMTPRNLLHAPGLYRLFPEARFVNVVRDGRDVAASLLKLDWKSDPLDALGWWETRIRQADSAVADLPADAVRTVSFERLMVTDRERTFAHLIRFLGWRDEPSVRAFFDEELSAEKAHIGRWDGDIPTESRDGFDERYRAILGGLRRDGVALL